MVYFPYGKRLRSLKEIAIKMLVCNIVVKLQYVKNRNFVIQKVSSKKKLCLDDICLPMLNTS